MTETSHPEEIHTSIQNTIAILNAKARTVDAHARQDLRLAVETLSAADAAVDKLEGELDLVTTPDLNAAEEAQRLRHRLEEAKLRIATLEQQLAEAKDELQLESQIHTSDHERLRELERQATKMEGILETDAGAFGKFMDDALEQDQSSGRLKGRE